MSRVRVIGGRDRLDATLAALQDFGRLQLDRIPADAGLAPSVRDPAVERRIRALRRMRDDTDAAISLLEVKSAAPPAWSGRAPLARWARLARRARRDAERLRATRQTLDDERTLLARYEDFLAAFRVLLAQLADAQHLRVYGVTLPSHERGRVEALSDSLRAELHAEVIVLSRTLPSGDLAVLIAVPTAAREPMDRAFAAARIAEMPLPSAYGTEPLTVAAPRILARLAELPALIAAADQARADLAARVGAELLVIRATVADCLSSADAAALASATQHAFAMEGWVPRADVPRLRRELETRIGPSIVVEEVAREDWNASDAPVVLNNPRLFRPFEMLTSVLPLPAYGSIDPTPFIAVGFPMIFGMILGDAGYGTLLAAAAIIIVWRSAPGSRWRAAGQMALACATFSIVFGVLFGELFGSLGLKWFGMRPILMNREASITAAMIAAVGVGVAHTALGLLLGMIKSRREPRVAASRMVQLAMLALVVLAIMSAVSLLPSGLFGPFAIAVFVGFPVLLALEGLVAPIEFFSTLSSVLSYVRIMALGTASVLLATVANDMTGVFGSAVVGILFGLLFHLVNFGMGVFSPTVHALRLHYVEFFKHFYSPGGRPFEPFTHANGRASATTRGSL